MSLGNRVRKALGEGAAETRPDANDARFRGRTYAIPFEDVWQASMSIIRGDLACSLRLANDRDGIIIAESATVFPRRTDDVTLSIVLDTNAQTRVDMRSTAREGKADFGANARRVTRFFELLDRRLAESPWRPRSGASGTSADR